MTNAEGALEYALRVLRRRKIVFLVALITVPLAAYLVSSSQEEKYTATATLLFESAEESFEVSREAATNQALAELPAVAVITAEKLDDGTTAGEILDAVSASAANEMANLTSISATTTLPEQSARIANAYAESYIDFRRDADQAQVTKAIGLIERSLEALPAEKAAQGEALRERLNELEVERALKTGRTELVQPAGVPSEPSSPKINRNVLVGLLLGALLGFALAALLERVDRRVRTSQELEKMFGLPVLARIPRSRSLAGGSLSEMMQTPEAEAFRTLRTNLHYFNVDRDLDSILIASPEPDDGKSTVARGLAAAMAEMGDDVVLVEADLRKEGGFQGGRRNLEGLAGVLAGVPLDEALIEVAVSPVGSDASRTLTVLPSGSIPPNPPELLESEAMRNLMRRLTERFGLVVIDTPALGTVSDGLILAPLVSEVLAVGGVGKTSRDGIGNFMKQFALTKKQPTGLIVTMTDFDRSHYTYYRRPKSLLRG
jgi:capsular exopolysaccharide synthesis family protein